MKKYLDKNVYQASNERIKFVFDNFGKIYVSFSGGEGQLGIVESCCRLYSQKAN